MSVVMRDLLDYPAALDTVVEWIDAQWSAFSGRTPLQTRERYSQGILPGRLPITQVALVDGTLAGVASLRARDSYDFLPGATPWICNVYVGTEHRGRGVAGALCGALELTARTMGYAELFLATHLSENSLYHRIGFGQVREVPVHGELMYVLRKVLA